jgi:hypothetical protein
MSNAEEFKQSLKQAQAEAGRKIEKVAGIEELEELRVR